jgi:hypothetical protein
MLRHSSNRQFPLRLLGIGFAFASLTGTLIASRAVGTQIGDRVVFDQAPRLIRSAASARSPNSAAQYQFTIEVPANAGEPLEAIRVTPHDHVEDIALDHSDSMAFAGDSFAGGPELPLSDIGGPTDVPGGALFVFDPPVLPGNTVTVEIEAQKNPTQGGIYQYGVTAYPAGENGVGLFLGYGRLHLHDNQ